MDFLYNNNPALAGLLQDVPKTLYPQTVIDAAALSLFAVVATGYFLHGIAWNRQEPFYHLYFERPQLKDGSLSQAQKQSRNIAERLEEFGKQIVVFWGSQSGTAESFANRLARDLSLRFGLEAMTADLSDYDPETIALIPDTKLAIFIMATYGEGDPCDNAVSFWDWIGSSKDISLANIRYAAFGLGNSNYKYYNRVIDVVKQKLDQYGAKQLLPVGKADDAVGATEEDFITWRDLLFTTLQQTLGIQERPPTYSPSLSVVEDTSLDIIDLYQGDPSKAAVMTASSSACSPVKAFPMKNARELFTSTERNCVHMELDLENEPEVRYKTGDHLAVWPINPTEEVEHLLTALGFSERRTTPINIKSLDPSVKVKIPTPTSIEVLFRHYLEICSPVSRDTIRGLNQFAPTEHAKAVLESLSKNKDDYADYLARTHITLGRLLTLSSPNQTWSTLPLSFIVESLSTIQPRYYSISSSSVISPRNPTITALVSKTPLVSNPAQSIFGLTSNYLLSMSQNQTSTLRPSASSTSPAPVLAPRYALAPLTSDAPTPTLYAHIRRSKFKLPINSNTPLLLIASGTGLAPFRAFLSERAKLKSVGKSVGRILLVFGCRNPSEDYIYREELEEMQRVLNKDDAEGMETLRIVTAFSRMEGERKVYVQDRVEELGEEVKECLVEGGGNLYVCGRASMAREVGEKVRLVLGKGLDWSEGEAREWAEGMKRRGKWREDVWG